MNENRTAAEERALEIAHRDFVDRVSWSESYSVTVTTQEHGYVVCFMRQLAAGEPMVRGGGIRAGITYRIGKTFAIEKFDLPR